MSKEFRIYEDFQNSNVTFLRLAEMGADIELVVVTPTGVTIKNGSVLAITPAGRLRLYPHVSADAGLALDGNGVILLDFESNTPTR